MAKKTTLNPLNEKPKTLTDITKDFMIVYLKSKGTPDDIKWFKELVANNTKTVENKIDNGKPIQQADYKTIRKAFASRFFPNLIKEKATFLSIVEGL